MIVDCHCHAGRGDGSITMIRAGRRGAMPIDQLITSQRGMALILDSHINQPGNVGRDLRPRSQATNQPTLFSTER